MGKVDHFEQALSAAALLTLEMLYARETGKAPYLVDHPVSLQHAHLRVEPYACVVLDNPCEVMIAE
jgi:hypothetical protein